MWPPIETVNIRPPSTEDFNLNTVKLGYNAIGLRNTSFITSTDC